MPAAWQTWVPLQIDAFRGSPAVQSMAIGARAGYIYLLLALWQTDDCSLPNNPKTLRQNAGMTPKEWEQYGPDVLEKFTLTEVGNLRNERLYREWLKAKQIHEHRRAAAQKTNAMRTAATDAVTGSVTDQTGNTPESHSGAKAMNPAAVGEEMEAATRIFEQLGIAADYGTREITAQTIRLRAASDPTGEGILAAERWLLAAARADQAAGETINRFYFSDQKYLHKKNGKKAALEAEARVGTWNGDSPPPKPLRSIVSDKYFERTKKSKANGEILTEFDEELLRQEGIALPEGDSPGEPKRERT